MSIKKVVMLVVTLLFICGQVPCASAERSMSNWVIRQRTATKTFHVKGDDAATIKQWTEWMAGKELAGIQVTQLQTITGLVVVLTWKESYYSIY